MTVDVTQNLRPLKLVYITRPDDMTSLEKVIETNSFLWGARYNPVLPLYKEAPEYLKDDFETNDVTELLHGSLKFFEPDFIVITGDIQVNEIENPPCKIINLEDIYGNIAKEGLPGYGIGLWEIASEYYDKEFKFLRRDKLSHYFPSYYQGDNCFLKSVLGCFPKELPERACKQIIKYLEAKEEQITTDNYLPFLKEGNSLNIHRLNSYDLDVNYTKIHEKNIIFLLNPNVFIDIVDYINLKAAGYTVIPVLQHSLKSNEVKGFCLKFIEETVWIHRDNPYPIPVNMQKSRSLTQKELETFYRFVDPPEIEGQGLSKCSMQIHLPDFSSRWNQEKGIVSCVAITAEKKEIASMTDEQHIRSKAIAPRFISNRIPQPCNHRFANDIVVTPCYASNQETFGAGIYPSNSDEVAIAAGLFGIDEWLIKDSGITRLCRFEDELIFFDIQNAQEIFLSWLKSEGWDAKISDAGKVAYQMLKHLGGPPGIIFLQGEKLVKFLTENCAKDGPQTSSGIEKRAFKNRIREAYKDHYLRCPEDKFFKNLFDYNVFQLGTELQCDVCSRRSWHPIDSLNYTIKCLHCLNTFEVPSHDPDSIKWSYKTIGPFSAAGKAAGSYAVLLTAGFFNDDIAINHATTTILSFEAEKGDKKFEADVGLFYRDGSDSNRRTELIFCECKTYNGFTKEDVDKMQVIGKEFPGSIIVFATLNEELTTYEKELIKPFVNACNECCDKDKPKNSVMVLTATELYTPIRPPICWKHKGKKYEPFTKSSYVRNLLNLCEATQEIYLDIEPTTPWWIKQKN